MCVAVSVPATRRLAPSFNRRQPRSVPEPTTHISTVGVIGTRSTGWRYFYPRRKSMMSGVLICVRNCNDEAYAAPGSTRMSDNGHILVVDDQRETSDVVRDYLTGEGFRVSTAEDGTGMRHALAKSHADLVILDLMLPGEDGLTLARLLRAEQPGVGIIILTGRSDTIDRIVGLEMGADDYLPKPFHLRELLARIKSVLRRVHARIGDQPTAARSRAYFAGWYLDLLSRELVSPSGAEVRLTTGEFDLLAVFIRNSNQVLSRDRLLDLARNREVGPFDRTIDVQVGRLRRKLEDTPTRPLIKTVRGVGYMFTPTVELR